MVAVDGWLLLISVPVLLMTGYLAILTLFSARRAPPPAVEPRLRFDVVVPAHDEALLIERTVKRLLALDWPERLRRILVVAHNCTDDTAERAGAAGAEVLVLDDPKRVGKGHALAFAFDRSVRDAFADAVVVVDADTDAPPNLLSAFAVRLEAGAHACQAGAAVSNASASWRTRLMALALVLFNGLRSLGRERLGLSCGLRGNGMCLSRELLLLQPPRAFSLVEDLEYGIALGRVGVRVRYVDEAKVASQMATSATAASTQRARWEAGRFDLLREVPSLLREAVRRRSVLLFDLAFDLLVPPLAQLVLLVGVGLALTAIASLVTDRVFVALVPWAVSALFLVLYVARGCALSGFGGRTVVATLAWSPAYLGWKIGQLRGIRRRRREWVRTERETPTDETDRLPPPSGHSARRPAG